MSEAIVVHDSEPFPERAEVPTTPMELMANAIAANNLDALERLSALQERWENRQAERALAVALAAFQAEVPHITKERSPAVRAGAKGGKWKYAALDDIERVVRPLLSKHGLSYTHDMDVGDGRMVVTCTIHHIDGASRPSQWVGPARDEGYMNDIQKVGSATTYARRYSLINALGLTTTDHDDDGMGGRPTAPQGPVSNDQLKQLQQEIKRVGADTKLFCEFLQVGSLAELPAARFAGAMRKLAEKGAKK